LPFEKIICLLYISGLSPSGLSFFFSPLSLEGFVAKGHFADVPSSLSIGVFEWDCGVSDPVLLITQRLL
jgi:hypothetical protein